MDEQLHRNRDYYADKPGYEGYLNWRVAALSEILQDAGYHTMMSGKWHLGFTKDVAPCSRGFDRSFSFLPGSGNHHGWEPQLKDDEFRVGFMKTKGLWMDEDQWIDIDTDLPKVFYSTTSFTDRMIQYLRERESDQGLKKKPFFGYLPFTAPHWPLQAPRSVVERYRGMYDDGPAELTKQRLERMERLGLIGKCVETPPPMGLVGPEWEEMSEEERAESARKMEIFAAMVDLIDQNIGRVVEQLKETGKHNGCQRRTAAIHVVIMLIIKPLPPRRAGQHLHLIHVGQRSRGRRHRSHSRKRISISFPSKKLSLTSRHSRLWARRSP